MNTEISMNRLREVRSTDAPAVTSALIEARVDEIIGDVNALEFNKAGVVYHGPVRITRTTGNKNKYFHKHPEHVAYLAQINGIDVAYRVNFPPGLDLEGKSMYSRLEGRKPTGQHGKIIIDSSTMIMAPGVIRTDSRILYGNDLYSLSNDTDLLDTLSRHESPHELATILGVHKPD